MLAGHPVPQNLLPDHAIQNITFEKNFAAGLPSDLLNHRPDLKAAEYELRVAGANIGAAKARMFPTISLTGSTGYASSELKDLFKTGNFAWSIGPNIDLPILIGEQEKLILKLRKLTRKLL